MISAKAIYFKNKNTETLMEIDERERPVSLQLFGSDPDLMAEIARQIEPRNFDILDINMGCPVQGGKQWGRFCFNEEPQAGA